MPLTTYDEYKAAITNPPAKNMGLITKQTQTAGTIGSTLAVAPLALAVPTTAVAPTNLTYSAFQGTGFLDTTNKCYAGYVTFDSVSTSAAGGILIDRLSHQGGLSGTVTTEQTTNLPTAALTRNTSGVGVFIALQIYTQIGTTATTVTVRYTNTANASSTSQAVVFGGTSFREANRFISIPLADGDIGVKSVEGVTVLATTGTAGAFGVVLYRPLMFLPTFGGYNNFGSTPSEGVMLFGGRVIEIPQDGCLDLIVMGPAAASNVCVHTIETT